MGLGTFLASKRDSKSQSPQHCFSPLVSYLHSAKTLDSAAIERNPSGSRGDSTSAPALYVQSNDIFYGDGCEAANGVLLAEACATPHFLSLVLAIHAARVHLPSAEVILYLLLVPRLKQALPTYKGLGPPVMHDYLSQVFRSRTTLNCAG